MRLNPFAKAETMTDEALDEVAREDEQRRLALAERARRFEDRHIAAEKKAAEEAEEKRQEKVAVLLREHERHAVEARRWHELLGEAVLAAGEAVRRRAAAQAAAWAIADQVASLGGPSPALALPDFGREALRAGITLSPVLSREFVERFNPRGGR
jgi:hypothetical protein